MSKLTLNTPPKLPLRLLKCLIKSDFLEEVEGDMEERFYDNQDQFGYSKASRLYYVDSIKLLRPGLVKGLNGDRRLNHYGMLTNHLKVAWRQLAKQKIFSAVKIGGFAIGIASCMLITLFINHELSYDKNHADGDRVFRLVNRWSESGEVGYWANVHGPLKGILEENIPEMELVARLVGWSWGDAGDNHIQVGNASQQYYEEGFFYADPELLEILNVPMVYGSRKLALKAPNLMVISRRKADVYFPNQNPVGQQLSLNDNPESLYTIGGVMEDFPATSHLQGDFIMTLFGRKKGPGTSGWCCTNYVMYTKLVNGADKQSVEEKSASVRKSLVIDQLQLAGQSGLEEEARHQSYYLQPIENIYLNPEEVGDYLDHGSMDLVWIFGSIAGIILLLACINFINLSTANSMARSREVGLRKALGSFRSGLVVQYLSESCLYSFLAILIGIGASWLVLPFFNELTGLDLMLPWTNWWFVPGIILSSIVLGLLSGIYPAVILSGFQPVEALKGTLKFGNQSALQSGMVVFQFTATVILIICAFVVQQQFEYIMSKPLGYEKEQVVNLLGLDTMDEERRTTFKKELLTIPAVQDATMSDYLPVAGGALHNRSFWKSGEKGLQNGVEAAVWFVDENYLSTMTIQLKEGDNFRPLESGIKSILINEKMAETLQLEHAIGNQVIDMFDEKYTITGVIENFHFETILGHIRPLAMVRGNGKSVISVKLEAGNMNETLQAVSDVWDDFNPNQELRYQFMDLQFEKMYADLNRQKTLFLYFMLLSLVIACSGLFALSLYLIGKKSKEISVRKVLGASLGRLLVILIGDFMKLVLLAIVIAMPIAWYFSEFLIEWMAYRIELNWPVFVLGGLMACIVAVATISFEAIRASSVNPAAQLRQE